MLKTRECRTFCHSRKSIYFALLHMVDKFVPVFLKRPVYIMYIPFFHSPHCILIITIIIHYIALPTGILSSGLFFAMLLSRVIPTIPLYYLLLLSFSRQVSFRLDYLASDVSRSEVRVTVNSPSGPVKTDLVYGPRGVRGEFTATQVGFHEVRRRGGDTLSCGVSRLVGV